METSGFPSHLHPQVIEERKVGRKLVQEEGFNDDAIVKLSLMETFFMKNLYLKSL